MTILSTSSKTLIPTFVEFVACRRTSVGCIVLRILCRLHDIFRRYCQKVYSVRNETLSIAKDASFLSIRRSLSGCDLFSTKRSTSIIIEVPTARQFFIRQGFVDLLERLHAVVAFPLHDLDSRSWRAAHGPIPAVLHFRT